MCAATNDGGISNNIELQQRYLEAMKRRELRRAKNEAKCELEDHNSTHITRKDNTVVGKESQNESVDENKDADESKVPIDTNHIQPEVLKSKAIRFSEEVLRENDEDITGGRSRGPQQQHGKSRFQVYETYFSEEEIDNDDFQDEYAQTPQRNKPSCQWETYKSTSVLFPPLSKSRNPKAIIHFVGGTFFGSYPRKFYGKFLEDLSAKCDAVVVATPIPLILPGRGLVNRLGNLLFDDSLDGDWEKSSRRDRRTSGIKSNPLDHLHLAEAVQKEFNSAYRDVIIDEYCYDFSSEEQVEEFMKSVPIVGVGHSLGARIQAISCSHPNIIRYLAMGKGKRLIRSGREGMIYLGFANWESKTSIPGIDTLEKTVKQREMAYQKEERERRGVGTREDVYGRRRRQGRVTRLDDDEYKRRYDRNYDRYSQYDAEDLDLADIFGDVISGVAKGAKQIGAALTPVAEDLEFKPSPSELWDALSSSNTCRNSLIVQFDDDPIDQGSRLARTLLKVSNETDTPPDVKFARLKGGHLTPVSFRDGMAKILPNNALAVLTSSSDYLVQQLGDETSKSSRRKYEELSDVVDTVASYIQDAI